MFFLNVKLLGVFLDLLLFFEFSKRKLSCICCFELAKSFSDGFFTDMDRFYDLCWGSPKTMHPRRNQNSSTTKPIRPSTQRHPRSVHRLDQSNCSISHKLELIAKFQFTAKSINKQTGIDNEFFFVF